MAELQPPEGQINGVGSSENAGLGSKRQRRPSVRLGDIGDQPATLSYDSYVRRTTKQWNDSAKYHRHPKDAAAAGKSSKTRPLTNLGNGGADNNNNNNTNTTTHEALEIDDNNKTTTGSVGDGNFDLVPLRKAKRGGGPTKRVRSNWVVSNNKIDQETTTTTTPGSGEDGGDHEGFRDFDPEGSQSPLKENSLENPTPAAAAAAAAAAIDVRTNSDRGGTGVDKEGLFSGKRRSIRARVSASRDHDETAELELDDTDARDWKCGNSADRNGGSERRRFWNLEDSVRMWLNGLGLGQYAPVFEIHEVDEEVLPQLTLEDLKDMGINAVGSRRKLYSAIQKLAKGFS